MKIDELLEILEPGDFILFDNESFISKIIKRFQKNSHVGIYSGAGFLYHMTYPTARKDYLPDYIGNQIITVMRFNEVSDSKIGRMLRLSKEDIDAQRPYNFKGLIAGFPLFLLFRRIGIKLIDIAYNDGKSVVCSAWAVEKARSAGIPVFAFMGIDTATPDDILHSYDMFSVLNRCKVELS